MVRRRNRTNDPELNNANSRRPLLGERAAIEAAREVRFVLVTDVRPPRVTRGDTLPNLHGDLVDSPLSDTPTVVNLTIHLERRHSPDPNGVLEGQ